MNNSSAISLVAAACRSRDKINTLKLAADCGMSRRWVQKRIKTLKRAAGLDQDKPQDWDSVSATDREPTMIRFLDGHGRPVEVTHYAPMSAHPTAYQGVANPCTGGHYDA